MSCLASGGYPETRPSLRGDPQPCHFPFVFNNINYTSCIPLSQAIPFMTPLDPNELVVIENRNSWCALVPKYGRTDDATKRMWGYCDCSTPVTKAPTLLPTSKSPTLQPTNVPTAPTITLEPSVSPTQYPTFVTSAPISERNASVIEALSRPAVAAGLGVGASLLMFACFFLIFCCCCRARRRRKDSSAVVAYPGDGRDNKKNLSPTSSSTRRFPLTRPNWGGNKEEQGASTNGVVVHVHDVEDPPIRPSSSREEPREANQSVVIPPKTPSPGPPPAPHEEPETLVRATTIEEKREVKPLSKASTLPLAALLSSRIGAAHAGPPGPHSDIEEKSSSPPPPLPESRVPDQPNPVLSPPQPMAPATPAAMEKYQKMLKIGLSADAIRHAMAKDGVDPNSLPV